jgi:hypothetical protein
MKLKKSLLIIVLCLAFSVQAFSQARFETDFQVWNNKQVFL